MRVNSKAPITSFLVKVASRCNLNCDYCYVFNHADQSWKSMPPLMSEKDRKIVAERIGSYTKNHKIPHSLVAFHGGEPLLMKASKIVETAQWIREAVSEDTIMDFSLQTNGVLLTDDILKQFSDANIGVSLSLDGPKLATDLHRVTHKGKSSYEGVMSGYQKLINYPNIFMGVIAVIDPRVKPRELLSFFNELNPPKVDFLLPDANYKAPPFLRDKDPDIYLNWILEAFDLWLDEYPNLKIRLFDTLLQTVIGSQSGTDFFGFGNVTMLTIETDGAFHDLDVLKITTEGYSSLGLNIRDHTIDEAANSSNIERHNQLLSLEGVSAKCKACPVFQICGAGSVPHRYNENGFDNPTVYCREMFGLITHAQKRLNLLLGNSLKKQEYQSKVALRVDPRVYNTAIDSNVELNRVYEDWCERTFLIFEQAIQYGASLGDTIKNTVEQYSQLPTDLKRQVSYMPSAKLWAKALLKKRGGLMLYDFDGHALDIDNLDIENLLLGVTKKKAGKPFLHPSDVWLRKPFGSKVVYEEDGFVSKGETLINEALLIIEEYNPALKKEILHLSPVIVFIQDPNADPESFVSFSDNEVPGALYVCIRHSSSFASPHDIADSIIHEHRHQKLYLLEEFSPVITSNFPYVSSPWRKEPRPVSGLFHAAFVFNELEKFWYYLSHNESGNLLEKALRETQKNQRMLKEAFSTLENCPLTDLGIEFLDLFKKELTDEHQRFGNKEAAYAS
jgi:uncharacterized protein